MIEYHHITKTFAAVTASSYPLPWYSGEGLGWGPTTKRFPPSLTP
jgi:hypothetical protein